VTSPRVLVVDDKDNIVKLLARILSPEFDVTTASDGTRALALIVSHDFDVIVSDIRMPGADGMTVLQETRRQAPETEVILMTAFATVQDAVAAMKLGAYDYLQKPFEPDEALMVVRRAVERRQLRAQARDLQTALAGAHRFDSLVAESRGMRQVVELIQRAAASDATVLITGESGTGKEVIARAIHRLSPRSDRNFTAINCAAIPERLLESELFGHCKGAFSGATADQAGLFELVDGGTLLLDEIADLSPALQAKLLKVLEDGEVRRLGGRAARKIDVRVLAATGKSMEQAVERNEFRSDLYYRLNVVRLHIPPLRERPEDIPELLTHFARQAAQRLGRPVSITPAALAALTHHGWPGNVRELRNAVERAAVLGSGGTLDSKDFALGSGGSAQTAGSGGALDLRTQVEAVEREAIQRALQASNGNRRQAASLLGISLRTLFYKLRRLPVH
jgi:DNA-binding NtrC family response regulator